MIYVPKLEDNLFSVKRVTEKGFKVVFKGQGCEMQKKQEVLAKADHDGSLYKMCLTDTKMIAYKVMCEHCIKCKLISSKFVRNPEREKEPIRLVHSDVCGPMQVATPSGN